jgi:hypothetical protein
MNNISKKHAIIPYPHVFYKNLILTTSPMLHLCNFSDADAYIQAIKKMIE